MKNCDPLVSGPLLAMERVPLPLCWIEANKLLTVLSNKPMGPIFVLSTKYPPTGE